MRECEAAATTTLTTTRFASARFEPSPNPEHAQRRCSRNCLNDLAPRCGTTRGRQDSPPPKRVLLAKRSGLHTLVAGQRPYLARRRDQRHVIQRRYWRRTGNRRQPRSASQEWLVATVIGDDPEVQSQDQRTVELRGRREALRPHRQGLRPERYPVG